MSLYLLNVACRYGSKFKVDIDLIRYTETFGHLYGLDAIFNVATTNGL